MFHQAQTKLCLNKAVKIKNKYLFTFLNFCGSGVWTWLDWILCSMSHEAVIQQSAWAAVICGLEFPSELM
jgi:hypothetical protein